MVGGSATPAARRARVAASALEGEAGGVHEHQSSRVSRSHRCAKARSAAHPLASEAKLIRESAAAAKQKPSDAVAIVSYDKKPGIQAIATTAPDLPPAPGRAMSDKLPVTTASKTSPSWSTARRR
jgi:hypothetical protein